MRPCTIDSVSISQAITRPSVFTSGAGMSFSGPEDGADLVGEPARDPLELAQRQPPGVAPHAALGAAEGQVDQGGLERHHGGQGLDLVGVEVGVEADAALARPPGGVVVDPPPGEHLDRPVVEADGHRHLEQAPRRAQHAVDVGVELRQLGGLVEVVEDGLPGPGTHRLSLCRPTTLAIDPSSMPAAGGGVTLLLRMRSAAAGIAAVGRVTRSSTGSATASDARRRCPAR